MDVEVPSYLLLGLEERLALGDGGWLGLACSIAGNSTRKRGSDGEGGVGDGGTDGELWWVNACERRGRLAAAEDADAFAGRGTACWSR